MEYRVELDNYNGPMDLLLFLIKRDELDIYDIPIARITDSYMSYVHLLKEMTQQGALDINVAGEFLVMAASLMEIKSAMLLPQNPAPTAAGGQRSAAEELSDPRYELVQKLLEYKRFKDSATMLERAQASHSQRFPRFPAVADQPVSDEDPPLDMEEVQIWDLLEAFNRLMREVGIRTRMHEVFYDDTPLDMHAAAIEERLKTEPRLSLRQLILGRKNKSEMIGVFLAILELVREKRILVHQNEAHDDLEIEAAPEEHRKTFKEAIINADRSDPDDGPTLFDDAVAAEKVSAASETDDDSEADADADAESLLDDLEDAPKLEEDQSEEAVENVAGESDEGVEKDTTESPEGQEDTPTQGDEGEEDGEEEYEDDEDDDDDEDTEEEGDEEDEKNN